MITTERAATAPAQWRAEVESIDPTTFVFLDETSTQIVMTRRRGRAARKRRIIGTVPRNHGANLAGLMAITAVGVRYPCVFEGAVDGPPFQQWLTTWLIPVLPAGTTIVLDNLSVHRSLRVRQAIAAAQCPLRYLPPSSPNLNPIEQVFAKLKAHLRGLGRPARRAP